MPREEGHSTFCCEHYENDNDDEEDDSYFRSVVLREELVLAHPLIYVSNDVVAVMWEKV